MPGSNVYYYKCRYGRYGKYIITAYFMVSDQLIMKVDVTHQKMNAIAQSTWKNIYSCFRKRIPKKEFLKAMNDVNSSSLTPKIHNKEIATKQKTMNTVKRSNHNRRFIQKRAVYGTSLQFKIKKDIKTLIKDEI